MKKLAKRLLKRALPDVYLRISAVRARRHSQWLERRWGCVAISHHLIESYGNRVLAGPFAGLQFPSSAFGRHLAPKLLGSYEQELARVWQRVLERSYAQVINIGCGDGYYAVGLARSLEGALVHAFDLDRWARRVTRDTATINRVSNVVVWPACTIEWLGRHLQGESLILSDCEGYEDALLQPDVVPVMSLSDIVVELHEAAVPGVTERIQERFAQSHRSLLIPAEPRAGADAVALADLPPDARRLAVSEFRDPNQAWLFLESKARWQHQ